MIGTVHGCPKRFDSVFWADSPGSLSVPREVAHLVGICIKGLIYQIRCGTKSLGRKNGARIIYHKDESRLLILYIYIKNAASKISSNKIERILKECL